MFERQAVNKKLLIFIFILITVLKSVSQTNQFRFYQMDIYDGLSQNDVMCFCKDSKGFIWIGTQSGLNRFDGYKFLQFKADQSDTNSLTNNYIIDLEEDKNENLWIGTVNGLTRYDIRNNRFYKYFAKHDDSTQLKSNYITDIISDNTGKVWIIAGGGELHLYNNQSDNFKRFEINKKSKQQKYYNQIVAGNNGLLWISENSGELYSFDPSTGKADLYHIPLKYVTEKKISLCLDSKNTLWVYNKMEVFKFDLGSKQFTPVDFSTIGGENGFSGMAEDLNGNYWFSTFGHGIIFIENSTWTISRLNYSILHKEKTSDQLFWSVFVDREGTVWLGTQKNGFLFFHADMQKFELYQHKYNQPGCLSNNNVSYILEDSQKNIWIGTGYGLNLFDKKSKTFKSFANRYNISCLAEDDDNNIWIGSYGSGVYRYNPKTGKTTSYVNEPDNINSISANEIWSLYKDSQGTIWVGTIGRGVNRYNPSDNTFQRLEIKNRQMSADYIYTFYEDKKNNFWIGTGYGLILYNRKTGGFRYFLNDIRNPESLCENHAQCIYEDSRGYLWIGTLDGLNIFDYETELFKSFNYKDGLPGAMIFSIIEDTDHNLWVGTNNGLSKLAVIPSEIIEDVRIKAFNFSESDGLQESEFQLGAACMGSDGALYFGGSKGLNVLNSLTFNDSISRSKIAITNFLLFNKPVSVGEKINGRVLLKYSITEKPEIILKFKENHFSIEFSALDFTNAKKVVYSYFLKGFNDRWINTDGNYRIATYTNLRPGHYTFKVKTLNQFSLSNNDEISLKIRILPPWYKKNWAILSYFFIFAFILSLTRKAIIKRERLKALIREEHMIAEQQRELNAVKTNFFTKISHELRTPLTLILTPLEKIHDKKIPGEVGINLSLIYRNAQKLLYTVNQLLDFRKLETRNLKLNISYGDIIAFLEETLILFTDLAEKKNIRLMFHSTLKKEEMNFDRDKIEKLMYNLLFNAFKFTPENGLIKIEVDKINSTISAEDGMKHFLEIKVSDTGPGIPNDEFHKIFDPYYQGKNTRNLNDTGNGIGLALVKEFAELHGGAVSIESKINQGSAFIVKLPVDTNQQAFNNKEPEHIQKNYKFEKHPRKKKIEVSDEKCINEQNNVADKELDEKSILVVEDDYDLREFIAGIFKADFIIYSAPNGTEAMEIAGKKLPDLIISDIMMPGADGYTLCHYIKNNIVTSHIPVILLTAKNSEESKLKGFNAGADEYIEKPFNAEILAVRVNNLIKQRRKLIEKFSRSFHLEPGDILIQDKDKEFLQKTIKIIEDHMSDTLLDIDLLASELALSRTQLYRKLKALTDYSTNQFIRIIRLKRAAQFFRKGQLTINEVMYETGFSNHTYFTNCFREYFGKSPKEFIKNNHH